MTLLYLDTETTGLDPDRHEVWEIAYAIDDGPVLSSFVAHSVVGAEPAALRINNYLSRFVGVPFCGVTFEIALREAAEGATLVGANPAFDAAFLRARWGVTPWRYRLLDIEAYAMPALGLSTPAGLSKVAESLRDIGFEIPEPDHSAGADVATLRAIHLALGDIYAGVAVDRMNGVSK